jgi:alcohol dehydrogenase (cytochrome c)
MDPKTGMPIEPNYPVRGVTKNHCPNILGGRNWNHGAYNPDTKLWYSTGMEVCNDVTATKQEPVTAMAGLSLGLSDINLVAPTGKKADGWLGAFDPLTGKQAWKVRFDLPPMSSVLTTAGGLVFMIGMDGKMHAFDTENGKELWNFNAGTGSRGGPISYSANGKQYIAIPTGLGSAAPAFLTGVFPQIRDIPAGAAMVVFSVE